MSTDRLQVDAVVDSQRQCRNCGSHTTAQLRRGYSDNSGVLHHCPSCEEPDICYRDMMSGAGAIPDYDPATDRTEHAVSDSNPIFHGGDRE